MLKINTKKFSYFLLIVDKVSKTDLMLLILINKQLQKVWDFDIFSTNFIGKLLLVVLIETFDQFALVTRKSFWDKPYKNDEINKKILENKFSFFFNLTKQIQLKINHVFQKLLK